MFGIFKNLRRKSVFLLECTRYLDQQLDGEQQFCSSLSDAAKRPVRAQNVAKLDLITKSDDWYAAAASHAARELDGEAQVGIFLFKSDQEIDIPGVTGELSKNLDDVWSEFFQSEAEALEIPTATHQNRVDYLVSIYLRANFDSIISTSALMMCAEDAGKTVDDAKELVQSYRNTLYRYYELLMRQHLKIEQEDDELLFAILSETVQEIGILEYSEAQREMIFEHAKNF